MKRIQTTLPPDIAKRFRAYCARYDVQEAELARRSILFYLDRHDASGLEEQLETLGAINRAVRRHLGEDVDDEGC